MTQPHPPTPLPGANPVPTGRATTAAPGPTSTGSTVGPTGPAAAGKSEEYQEGAAEQEQSSLTPRQTAERNTVQAMRKRVRAQWAEGNRQRDEAAQQREQTMAAAAEGQAAQAEHPDPGVAQMRARVQQQRGMASGSVGRTRTLARTMPAAQEAARAATGQAPAEEEEQSKPRARARPKAKAKATRRR